MVAEGNVGVAFGLVTAAGLCTTLGAACVWCASVAQPRLLAGSLGFAAGVMLYVSFAEIFLRKSVSAFESVTTGDGNAAYRWSTLCFFGGMVVVAILDRIVHFLAEWGARRSCRSGAASAAARSSASTTNLLSHEEQLSAKEDVAPGVALMRRVLRRDRKQRDGPAGGDVEAAAPGGKPGAEGGDAGERAASEAGSEGGHQVELSAPVEPLAEPCDAMTTAVVAASQPNTVPDAPGGGSSGSEVVQAGATSSRTPPAVVEIMQADHHAFMLKKMGLLTALALFIHNFPEGLATFVGALADTKVGVGLAVAIAMHNIPEGICVAMPIYYATGSRWKGFIWAFLSGVSEPVGGLVGYLVLDGDNDLSFAIVFGFVAGMMVYISVKELIPTALRYDPKDSLASSCVVAGMVVMAASLLLFTL